MALRLSGLRDRAVFMPDGAGAYPAYGDRAVFIPDGAALIRPT
ncbi:Hypothetical protein ABZS17H1_00501 [Kosakonia cowanii]